MADAYLSLASRKAGQTTLVLVNGDADTGYVMVEGTAWSAPTWDVRYSGQRGTQGARAAGAVPQNRGLVIPLTIEGGTTDLMLAKFSALARKVDEVRRSGGVLTWRPQGATYRTFFDVMAGSAGLREWGRQAHFNALLDVDLECITAPYASLDPFDVQDAFSTDTSDDYSIDAGDTVLAVSGGQLAPSDIGTARWRRTVDGYEHGDVQVTMRVATGSSITGFRFEVFGCADITGAETFLFAAIDETTLRVGNRVAGTATDLSTASYAIAASTAYWLRFRREGALVTAELFAAEPTPMATPDATCSAVLTSANLARHHRGHSGFQATVVDLAERYDSLEIQPFTYRNLATPEVLRLGGLIPGDAPALCDLTVTPSGGSAAPVAALVGWWPAVGPWNMVTNGDFEDDTDGWVVTAVSGVTGAATSITRITTAARVKYGAAAGQIVTPATANTGGSYFLRRRFKKGRRYLAMLWASSASQTTNTRLRLGVSGDIASESAAALSTTPSLRAVAWTPAADADGAYLAFEVTAATLTTMAVDGVVVCEPVETTLSAAISSGTAETCTVTVLPERLPDTPFLCLIDSEIVVVSAIDEETNTWTIGRGIEGTTAATHSSGAAVYVLPELAHHREGKGAQPACGLIEAESADASNLYTFSVGTSVTSRLGAQLGATGLSGAGSAAADWLIDPHLLVPDDFTQGEIAVEVWARVGQNATNLTTPRIILAAAPETATVSSGVLSSSYGAVRYSDEHGSAGRTITRPSAGQLWRWVRAGTIRLIVDRQQPQRWRLQTRFTWQTGTASGEIYLDYLALVPASARALSPSLKALDSSYPKFCPSTAETVKTIAADLSGVVQRVGYAAHPDHGLGGSLLEFPEPYAEAVVKLSSLAPDDPTSDTSNEQLAHSATVHFSITPRVALARGAE